MADISIVTTTARALIAEMLDDRGMWAVLHVAEPTPSDPLSTIVKMSGQYAVKVDWERDGSILRNAVPLAFAGIADLASVSWIAITTDSTAKEILFAGEVEEPEASGPGWDVFLVPTGSVEIVVA
jgi:hypothetical protein